MRRFLWMLVPAFLASAAGCIPLFYAYPSVSYVPGLSLGRAHDKVHVFRVDITDDSSDGDAGKPGQYALRELPLPNSGFIAPQGKLAIDSGFYWNLIAISYTSHTEHTMRLRLYREGYDLIEIHPWQGASMLWHETADLAAQEKAVDQLLAPTEHSVWPHRDDENGLGQLEPGSYSQAHHNALVFAIHEYQRIAEEADIDGHARCMAKAKKLRDLAGR